MSKQDQRPPLPENALPEAQQTFLDKVPLRILGGEDVNLDDALGRTLHNELRAPEDSPPYNRAIVEGFLVHRAETENASDDSPAAFTIVGSVAPGDKVCPEFGPGEAIEVQTGSLLPDGDVAIVRMWEAQRDGDGFTTNRPFPPRFFIEERGCDIKQGDSVISAGTVLGPEQIGTAASLGFNEIMVSHPPEVTLFACGDEVITHTAPLRPGLIRDCNSPMLGAAIQEAGGVARLGGILGDDFEAFTIALNNALPNSDMIIISGGTAAADRDFVSDLIKEVGELIIDGVPMKSGRPLIMGMADDTPIIGVAGHPPEALRGFRLFGEPALRKLLGQEVET